MRCAAFVCDVLTYADVRFHPDLFQRLSAQFFNVFSRALMAANLSHQADHYLACFFFCAHMWGTTPSSNLWCKGSLLVTHPIPLQQAEDTGKI